MIDESIYINVCFAWLTVKRTGRAVAAGAAGQPGAAPPAALFSRSAWTTLDPRLLTHSTQRSYTPTHVLCSQHLHHYSELFVSDV